MKTHWIMQPPQQDLADSSQQNHKEKRQCQLVLGREAAGGNWAQIIGEEIRNAVSCVQAVLREGAGVSEP